MKTEKQYSKNQFFQLINKIKIIMTTLRKKGSTDGS